MKILMEDCYQKGPAGICASVETTYFFVGPDPEENPLLATSSLVRDD